jgi:hypothetical protein
MNELTMYAAPVSMELLLNYHKVLALAKKEAFASGIFFGSTGWSGNVVLLGLLGYGECPVS